MMTAIDWVAAGAAEPDAGRRTIRERLEAAGLVLDTPDYNRAVSEFRRGQAAVAAARRETAVALERKRIAPYLAEARANVLAWGCVEDGSLDADEIEEQVIEEATRMADEADEAAEEQDRAAEREAEQLADYFAKQEGLRAAVAAAEAAVAGASGWRMEWRKCSNESSRYYWLLFGGDPAEPGDYEQAVSLRISDHHAKNGAGWNESKQERHDAPDVNIVLRRGADGEYTFDLTPLMETLDR